MKARPSIQPDRADAPNSKQMMAKQKSFRRNGQPLRKAADAEADDWRPAGRQLLRLELWKKQALAHHGWCLLAAKPFLCPEGVGLLSDQILLWDSGDQPYPAQLAQGCFRAATKVQPSSLPLCLEGWTHPSSHGSPTWWSNPKSPQSSWVWVWKRSCRSQTANRGGSQSSAVNSSTQVKARGNGSH